MTNISIAQAGGPRGYPDDHSELAGRERRRQGIFLRRAAITLLTPCGVAAY
jgi:hypothetical protein